LPPSDEARAFSGEADAGPPQESDHATKNGANSDATERNSLRIKKTEELLTIRSGTAARWCRSTFAKPSRPRAVCLDAAAFSGALSWHGNFHDL
jgi:hypothetical protein